MSSSGARARAARRYWLDRRRGDHRLPHVPPLLPRDRRRASADGLRLGPDRLPRQDRQALLGRPRQAARAEAGLRKLAARVGDGEGRARMGRPDLRLRRPLARLRHVPGTRMHYGAGYTGNGVGPSWLGGQILASLALGLDDAWPACRSSIAASGSSPERINFSRERRAEDDDRRRGGGGVRPQAIGAGALRRRASATPRPLASERAHRRATLHC